MNILERFLTWVFIGKEEAPPILDSKNYPPMPDPIVYPNDEEGPRIWIDFEERIMVSSYGRPSGVVYQLRGDGSANPCREVDIIPEDDTMRWADDGGPI